MELDALCDLIVDCEHKTAPTQATGYPSIRTPNIGRGRLLLEGVNRVSEETYTEWTRRTTPKEGDLILAREAPVGNVAIIPRGLRVCLGQRTVLIRPDRSKVDPQYLVYLLLGHEVQGIFQSQATGATVGHLNVKDIRTLSLPPIPPLHIQKRVGAILSAYDDLIENNTRRIAILEEMTRALYREWFINYRFPGHERVRLVESPVGRIPEGWAPTRLKDHAEDRREAVQPEDVPPMTPYVGLEHLPRRSVALADWGIAADIQSMKLAFRRGDVLFGKIRPYFHKVAVAPINGVCSTDAIVINAKRPEVFLLVLCCVSSDEFITHATQTSNGTKMPRANWTLLLEYPLPMPPAPVLDRINALMRPVVDEILNLAFSNRNLRASRDLLLPKLISGELDLSRLVEAPVEAAG